MQGPRISKSVRNLSFVSYTLPTFEHKIKKHIWIFKPLKFNSLLLTFKRLISACRQIKHYLILINRITENKMCLRKLIFGINNLNAALNPICHLLALLGAHHILHVSRIRVKSHSPSAGIIRSSPYSPR